MATSVGPVIHVTWSTNETSSTHHFCDMCLLGTDFMKLLKCFVKGTIKQEGIEGREVRGIR